MTDMFMNKTMHSDADTLYCVPCRPQSCL